MGYKLDGNFGPDEAVPPESIVGAWKVDASGRIVGEFIPNPNYRPKKSKYWVPLVAEAKNKVEAEQIQERARFRPWTILLWLGIIYLLPLVVVFIDQEILRTYWCVKYLPPQFPEAFEAMYPFVEPLINMIENAD